MSVTSTIQAIWDDDAEAIVIAAIATTGPVGAFIAGAMKLPIIGPILTNILNHFVNELIATSVIDIKIGMIDFLSAEAQSRWAPQLTILKQYQASGQTMTAAQQAAYDAALQALVENHGSIVNS